MADFAVFRLLAYSKNITPIFCFGGLESVREFTLEQTSDSSERGTPRNEFF
jgi:hypothetical protein